MRQSTHQKKIGLSEQKLSRYQTVRTIISQQRYLQDNPGKKVVAADRIGANNANRTYMKKENIAHNFVPKGNGDTPEKEQLRNELNRERPFYSIGRQIW